MKESYEPYGKEWEKEMMKWSKEALVEFIKTSLIDSANKKNIMTEHDFKNKWKEGIRLRLTKPMTNIERAILQARLSIIDDVHIPKSLLKDIDTEKKSV